MEKSKKNTLSKNDYKLLAKKFKSAGLIDLDLRHNEFTPYQKRKLRELKKEPQKMAIAEFFYTKKTRKNAYNELVHAVHTRDKIARQQAEKEFFKGHRHGLQEFQTRTIKDKEKLQAFKEAGYTVIKNKVYIKTEFGKTVHVKKMKSPLSGEKVLVVETVFRGKTSRKFVSNEKNILSELEAMKDKKLPPNISVMIAIGENNPMKNSEKLNYKDLIKYVQNWMPKDHKADREKLISEMIIVENDLNLFSK